MNLRHAVLAAVIFSILAGTHVASAEEPLDGRALYLNYCSSCHGRALEGQPNWMQRKPDGKLPAPPHDETGHTWHHGDVQLFKIIKEGLGAIAPGYATDMPSFGASLSDAEITAILTYIKSTWPERQRNFQALR